MVAVAAAAVVTAVAAAAVMAAVMAERAPGAEAGLVARIGRKWRDSVCG